MTVGFRIHSRCRKVDVAAVKAFRTIAVANVSDVMHRLSSAGHEVRPMHAGGVLAGPAFTVRTRPGDNLMVHKAIDLAEPGDILVVDAGGDLTNAIIGERMLVHAAKRDLAGFVIDGAVRDYAAIHRQDTPVFAVGVTHRGPYKNGPGEINCPIAIRGMVIEPGDLVLGDEDGLICVPFAHVSEILAQAQAKQMEEKAQMAAIMAGTSDRKWIDESLAALGCEIVE